MRLRRGKLLLAAISLIGGLIAILVLTFNGPPAPSDAYRLPAEYVDQMATQESRENHQPVALFIGDAYVSGAAGVPTAETFAGRTCKILQWKCVYDAAESTGYLTASAFGDRYVERLGSTKDIYLPDLVFVTGGRSDIGKGVSARSMSVEVSSYLWQIRTAWPTARVVVLDPFWSTPEPPPELVRLRADVRMAAQKRGFSVIKTADWLERNLISEDGVHPTPAGHSMISKRLVEIMRSR